MNIPDPEYLERHKPGYAADAATFRDPVKRRAAFYWFRLRHKSGYHRAFAIAALREARRVGW